MKKAVTATKTVIKTAGKKVRFELVTHPGREVFVAGSFNGWNPVQQSLKPHSKTGAYVATLNLPSGSHEYKFVVDGIWQIDPVNLSLTPDGEGSFNNILLV
ncbi:MAG: glycogen-binding domain-containing protein [bacterium]